MESMVKLRAEGEVARNYLALSREFQEVQLFGKAEETLHLALERIPDHPFLLARLANLYLNLDMPEKALDSVDQLIRAHGHLRFPYFLRGRILERTGRIKRAVAEYQRALFSSEKDLCVLHRLVPLFIQQGREWEALDLIDRYQRRLDRPHLFAREKAEALLGVGKPAAAFNTLREALLQHPDDRDLLTSYLRLSIRISKKSPRDVYGLLNLSMPRLTRLPEEELLDLDLDYAVHHHRFDDAMDRLDAILERYPDSYRWARRRAMLRLEMGAVEESIGEFRDLFMRRPADEGVRNVLENYFIVTSRADAWKPLLQEALRASDDPVGAFTAMRPFGAAQDWLDMCELDYDGFIRNLTALPLPGADLADPTFAGLPLYALEIFIGHLAVHNRIPDPETLWSAVYRERQKKQQVPPFQLEDLEAAYPVWLFGLHIYFLCRRKGMAGCAFLPALFQSDRVAASLEVNGTTVQIDLSMLLKANRRPLKSVIKADRGFRWRWPESIATGEQAVNRLALFSPEQFARATVELERAIATHGEESDPS